MVIRGIHPERGRSLRADAWMFAEPSWYGCRLGDVRVVFSGTPAFWEDHARELRGTHRFAVGIVSSEDLEIRDVKFGFAANRRSRRCVRSTAGRSSSRTPRPAKSSNMPSPAPGPVMADRRHVRDWGVHWAPLAVEFTADWVSTRTVLGSCYVRLPSLPAPPRGRDGRP